MFKKKQSLFVIVSILLVAAIACAVTLRPLKASAAEYMQLSKENRIKYAQDRYAEFAKNPDEEYEVLISFSNVSYKEIAEILSGQDNILSAFHCFEANGECAVGGYTECEGKNAETVIEDYYSSVYNLVVGQIESYDDFVEELKKSYKVDTNFVSSEKMVDSEEVYAWWLSSLGYEVHLFDLSETNIKMSAELAKEYPNVTLKSATVCDARSIPRPDKSADAILLMGPLYSITEYAERIIAIRESRRLLKNDGLLFSAALTPYSILIPRIVLYHIDESSKRRELDDPAVISAIERALEDGCYINPEKKNASGLGSSHLRTAKALREELAKGGFATDRVHGVMGGAWLAPNLDELLANAETRALLMRTVRMLDTHEEIIGLSGHLLAVSRKDSWFYNSIGVG